MTSSLPSNEPNFWLTIEHALRAHAPLASRAINEEGGSWRAARDLAPLALGRAARGLAVGHEPAVSIFLPFPSTKRRRFLLCGFFLFWTESKVGVAVVCGRLPTATFFLGVKICV